jgi:hypothetical protein
MSERCDQTIVYFGFHGVLRGFKSRLMLRQTRPETHQTVLEMK